MYINEVKLMYPLSTGMFFASSFVLLVPPATAGDSGSFNLGTGFGYSLLYCREAVADFSIFVVVVVPVGLVLVVVVIVVVVNVVAVGVMPFGEGRDEPPGKNDKLGLVDRLRVMRARCKTSRSMLRPCRTL